MIGYSWVPITALFCYLFLFLTFLASKKKEKVIRSFMGLMLIMVLWVGGSFAMRMQLWPSVNFWHHVSVLGMILVPPGYYMFVMDFLAFQFTISSVCNEIFPFRYSFSLHSAIFAKQ